MRQTRKRRGAVPSDGTAMSSLLYLGSDGSEQFCCCFSLLHSFSPLWLANSFCAYFGDVRLARIVLEAILVILVSFLCCGSGTFFVGSFCLFVLFLLVLFLVYSVLFLVWSPFLFHCMTTAYRIVYWSFISTTRGLSTMG